MAACVNKMSQDERATGALRALYEGMGYRKFKMSKFEEYELYLENKSFLPQGGIVTFTGRGGKLLALKPDITLSILKNVRGETELPRKLYYTENVYRADHHDGDVREIMQVGLEYVGEVDLYAMGEVVTLACQSLEALEPGYVLDLSHLGLVMGLMDEAKLSENARRQALACIAGKNGHELRRLLARERGSAEAAERLIALAGLGGEPREVLAKADELAVNDTAREAVEELKKLCALLEATVGLEHIRLDFSIINDMSYYNGLIFRGYIPGVPAGILSGGRYDNLVRRLSCAPGAIGFAVYLDLLDNLAEPEPEFDVDFLIICPGDDMALEAMQRARRLRDAGLSVRVQAQPGRIRAREIIRL
ncbi:MAG: ATP phosphoribosyltransferase regulatory subunit [Candidatus Heteroscillospira sp.]